MNSQSKKIDFVNIDCDSNYFNTDEQVRIRNTQWFVETSIPSVITGSNIATSFFERKRVEKLKTNSTVGQAQYATGSIVTDPSGNERKILSLQNDYIASSSLDAYKNGVELLRENDWVTGLAKISAGTPGHLFDSMRFGTGGSSLMPSTGSFVELQPFDPVLFVETGGDPSQFTYPIFIESDALNSNGYDLDGTIEPLSIRNRSNLYSTEFPSEFRSFKGQFGNGNIDWRGRTDVVVSVDYRKISVNRAPFLDAFGSSLADNIVDSKNAYNSTPGYICTDENYAIPFDDKTDIYFGTTYVSSEQHSATCGFVYDNATAGTDSIAYGGLLY